MNSYAEVEHAMDGSGHASFENLVGADQQQEVVMNSLNEHEQEKLFHCEVK